MRRRIIFVTCLAAILISSVAASAQTALKVVEVGAPAVNCVFRTDCILPVTDSTGNINFPYLAPGTAWLQSRTFTGTAGAPGAGKVGYEYRVSLTEASGQAECIGGLTLNFGPVTQLPYKGGQLADVYVITAGGLGTIGIKSATKSGDVIEFEFSKQLCLDGPADIKNTTFFFGLAAASAPMSTTAQVWVVGEPPIYAVAARAPMH